MNLTSTESYPKPTMRFSMHWRPNFFKFPRQLLPISKSPGIRPIGVGEVPRSIIAKAVIRLLRDDIREAIGPLQVCVSLDSGCEAAVHAIRDLFESPDAEGVLLVDTGITITSSGKSHLGAPLGGEDFVHGFISAKVCEWVPEVEVLSEIAMSYPHEALIAFIHGVPLQMELLDEDSTGHQYSPNTSGRCLVSSSHPSHYRQTTILCTSKRSLCSTCESWRPWYS